MNVSLTPELEKLINEKLQSGQYQNAAEVIEEALRALQEREETERRKLEELRRSLQDASEQIDRGEYSQYDERTVKNLAEDVKATGARSLSRQKKPNTQ